MGKVNKDLDKDFKFVKKESITNFNKGWVIIIIGFIFIMLLGTILIFKIIRHDVQNWTICQNNYDGFILSYPKDWQKKIIPGVATILSKDGYIKLTIFVQPLDKVNAEQYIFYSNRSIKEGWGGIKLKSEKKINFFGYKAWQFDWIRTRLSPSDLNYYREFDVIIGKKVYTFMLKSDQQHFLDATKDLNNVFLTFKAIPAMVIPDFPSVPMVKREINIEGQHHRVNIPSGKTLWGILNPHKIGQMKYLDKLLPLEKQLDFKFQFLITYASLDTKFDQTELEQIYKDNRILMVALQPWWYGKKDDTSLIALIQGKYDSILREWAYNFKNLGDPVFVRFGNEMNGDWSTWSAWYTGKDTDIYKMAWEHVYNIFKSEGAKNVIFVFNPHDRSFPNFKWNNYLLYYPGDKTVDWIGLTGYNNGTSYPGDVWRDFDTIYDPLYRKYMNNFPDKPFMITEFSCNEKGGNKANWIQQCFQHLSTNYPNIKIVVWFNQVDGKWQYNIDSSSQSFEAFKKGLENPCYRFQAIYSK